MTQPNSSPNSFMQQNERKSSRTRSPRGKSPSGRMSRWPCKDYFKGTCNNSFCEKWHFPERLFYKTKSGCRFGEKCSYAHRQVDEQPSKRSKKNDDKSAVAMLKKNDLHESVWQPVVNRDERRDTRHELNRRPVGCRSSNTRQLGCVWNGGGTLHIITHTMCTRRLKRHRSVFSFPCSDVFHLHDVHLSSVRSVCVHSCACVDRADSALPSIGS